uniref:Tudor domain-containing protein n=1 Tax=Lotharella oceanica TaxID=641309 RepID=A0A7S2U0M8_9EUKA
MRKNGWGSYKSKYGGSKYGGGRNKNMGSPAVGTVGGSRTTATANEKGSLSRTKGMRRYTHYKVNAEVRARWSSDGNWYPAKIHRALVPGVRYEVRYYLHGNLIEPREVTQIAPV